MSKLFNFLDQPLLNNARQLCKADLISSSFLLKPYGIHPEHAEQLLKEGKQIFRHLVEVENNLLYYQNVLISVNLPRIKSGLPRLHVAYCKKMQDLMSHRHNTFFVSRSLNSERKIYIESVQNHQLWSIPICKYCLDLLSWQNYSYEMEAMEKNRIVEQFTLKQFYKTHDQPQIHAIFLAMSKEG